jgi:ABC-2 type transport system ATP-binding protein
LVRDEFMEGLLQQAGDMSVLISSHELSEIDGVATHVAFVDEGRLLFEESMNELMNRFREVRVTLEKEVGPAVAAPEDWHWLHVRTTGSVLTFVDARFSEEDLGLKITSLFGAVRRVDAQPMSLRSIFTTLARAARAETTGARGRMQ